MSGKKPLINILTRTSRRPKAFLRNCKSVLGQSYDNIMHIVSSDDEETAKYVEKCLHEKMVHVKLDKDEVIRNDNSPKYNTGKYFPYNLYINSLLDKVQEGYVVFLDDDDSFANKDSLSKIIAQLPEKNPEDTMIIWQMRMPNGHLIPPEYLIQNPLRIGAIGSPCIAFHISKRENILWDAWKCADFRFIRKIFEKTSNKKHILEPLVLISQIGDGKQGDT